MAESGTSAFGLLPGKADADLGTPLGRVSPNQPCNDLGSCLLDDVEAFDRLQRQLLRLGVVVHHPLDNEASKKMPHAMGRQRVARLSERFQREMMRPRPN